MKSMQKGNDTISLRDVFEFVAGRWYWFLLSVLLFVGGAWAYLETIQPVFQRSSTVLMKEDKPDIGTETFIFFGSNNDEDEMKNRLHIFCSSEVVAPVVEKLGLDVTYRTKKLLRMQDMYKKSPFEVQFIHSFTRPLSLQITPVSAKEYQLTSGEKSKVYTFGDTVTVESERIVVLPTQLLTAESYGQQIEVSRMSLELATQIYKSSLSAKMIEESKLSVITCKGTSMQRADDILNAIVDSYNEYCARDKVRVADNTAQFLNERIHTLNDELEALSEELSAYGLNDMMVSIDEKFSSRPATGKIRDEVIGLETKLVLGKYIQGYLVDASTNGELIPNIEGAGDIGIGTQIQSYNNLILQRNRLIENSGQNNSVVMNIETTLAATRTAITNSIDAYINSLQIKLNQLRVQEQKAQYSAASVHGAYGYYRQKKIKESLYSLLLKKQEENTLKMTVKDPVARVLEQPAHSAAPTPNRYQYLIGALVIGLLIPVAIWWIMVSLDTKIRNRKDIEENTSLNILAEIPVYEEPKKKTGKFAVKLKGNDALSESFRVMCAHLKFAFKSSKVIMLTSTTSGEGKSFVSANLAVTLAMSGKKVILVDLDLRKVTKSGLLLTDRENGVGEYLSGAKDDLKQLIIPAGEKYLPDVLPSGAVMSNPTECLMSDRLDRMIESLKKEYDCVIIDAVPAVGLADTLIANRVAELTIYLVRERVLDRRFLPEIEKMHKSGELNNMHVVLNSCQFYKNSYYGYYNYSKYYGYGHSYGYYGNKKQFNKTAVGEN